MLMVVANDLPASAVPLPDSTQHVHLQTVRVGDVIVPTATRDELKVVEYTPVQWPLAPSTAVSSGFGLRIAPCRGCSSDHQGVDFDPGEGTSIVAIADGVVVESAYEGGLVAPSGEWRDR